MAKYKKGKDGYWQARVWDGSYTETGQKHRVTLRSSKSSRDLERMVSELQHEVDAGTAVRPTQMSIPQYAEEWLKTKSVYQRNTVRSYRDIIRYYITPTLSAVPLSSLSKLHLQMLISRNASHPRTCQLIRRTILQIAESAVDDRYLPESVLRPLRSVELPKYRRTERRILTPTERACIASADLSPMQKCFVYLIYFCGLRRGEALALTPSDVFLTRSEVVISHSVEFIGNSSALKGPKSQNGYRKVPLVPQMAEFLKGYLPTLDSDYLIHKADGGLMTQSSFRRMWESIVGKLNKAAGGTPKVRVIVGLTPHIFRHTFCTELCYQIPKMSTKKIAQILGDDESMVIGVYSHIMEEKEDAPSAMEEALSL